MNFDDIESQKDDFIFEYTQQHGKDVSEEDIEIAWQEMLDELCQTESEIEIINNLGIK